MFSLLNKVDVVYSLQRSKRAWHHITLYTISDNCGVIVKRNNHFVALVSVVMMRVLIASMCIYSNVTSILPTTTAGRSQLGCLFKDEDIEWFHSLDLINNHNNNKKTKILVVSREHRYYIGMCDVDYTEYYYGKVPLIYYIYM